MKNGTLSLTSEKGGDEDHDKKIFEDFFVYCGVFPPAPPVVFCLEEELTLFIAISNPALGFPILGVAVRRHFVDTGQFLGDSGLISTG